ncbi:conserved hypothetical protein [Coccidioides posadasii str. Silveira]|uniref:Uncharacterized protein n=2 Tax=Coccidioides posadasii TaxID=199306 RepID=E9CXX9_COCPS|nr:conserved hypothetical protein [Coccidioides posadasii str. Silveira]KMM72635.1 hypothetical protein CPAG_08929 [Coccidioides posadasii RMSCC 3488]
MALIGRDPNTGATTSQHGLSRVHVGSSMDPVPDGVHHSAENTLLLLSSLSMQPLRVLCLGIVKYFQFRYEVQHRDLALLLNDGSQRWIMLEATQEGGPAAGEVYSVQRI